MGKKIAIIILTILTFGSIIFIGYKFNFLDNISKLKADINEASDEDEISISNSILKECIIEEYNSNNETSYDNTHVFTRGELNSINSLTCSSKELTEASELFILPNLRSLDLSNNELEDIDLFNNKNLSGLNLSNNKLSLIDLSDNNDLTILDLSNNNISEIDLTENVGIYRLNLSNNKLKKLNLETNENINELILTDAFASEIEIEYNTDFKLITLPNNSTLTYTIDSVGDETIIQNNTDYIKAVNLGTTTVTSTILENTFIQTYIVAYPKVENPTCLNITYNGDEQAMLVDTDEYTVSNNKGINVGNYNINVSLKENYTWEDNSIEDKVITCNIAALDISGAKIEEIDDQEYTGNNIIPVPVVRISLNHDIDLIENQDYTVSYSSNKNPGTATVTISGINNYTGTKDKQFEIIKSLDTSKLNIKNANIVRFDVNSNKKTITDLIGESNDVVILLNDSEIEDNSKLKTGDTLKIYDEEYIISIYGDVNGDGKLSVHDVSKLYAYIKDKNLFPLTDAETIAADYAENGKIQIQDVSKMYYTIINR